MPLASRGHLRQGHKPAHLLGNNLKKRTTLPAAAALAGLLLTATACTAPEPNTQPSASAAGASTPTADGGKRSALGTVVSDSFGNADYYTTLPGDTPAMVALSFRISEAKLAEFNNLQPGVPLAPGTKLRLIPAPGPITGARGTAVIDANGIPTGYVVEAKDTLDGITYRFGINSKQLAEANQVPYVGEQGGVYFLLAGKHLQLQKNPVDSRSGTGDTVDNSFHQPIYYTTVDGDSLDSLGYKFRSTTAQLMQYNPSLTADRPIPAGTKVRLMPGELKIDGANGTFTADADGIPITYTTAPGDTEHQIEARFKVPDLGLANRPLTGTATAWYSMRDIPTGEIAPGQTISLALSKPINK